MTIQFYILLALGAALTVIALALLTIKVLNAATRLALGIAAGIGLSVVGVIMLQSVSIPTLVDVDVVADLAAPSMPWGADSPSSPRRGLSAAASITLTLSLIVVTMVAVVVIAIGVWWWWTQRQRREKLELMRMLYGGTRSQLPRPQRRVLHSQQPYVVPQPQRQPEFEPWEVVQ